jgi:hypothetical protein
MPSKKQILLLCRESNFGRRYTDRVTPTIGRTVLGPCIDLNPRRGGGTFATSNLRTENSTKNKKTPWSVVCKGTIQTELPSHVREANADLCRVHGRRVVSATRPHGCQSLFSRPVPLYSPTKQLLSYPHEAECTPISDPPLLRKSDIVGNRTRDLWICSQGLCPLEHRGRRIHPRRN